MLKEEVSYTEENGLADGHITLTFGSQPDILLIIKALAGFCKSVREGKLQVLVGEKKVEKAEQKEPAPATASGGTVIFKADETKVKKPKEVKEHLPGKLPSFPKNRVSSWEYKYIKAALDLDDLIRDHFIRFPNTILTKDTLTEIWVYYHPKANEKREKETPAPRAEEDAKPGESMGLGSKVVQVSGFSPAVGVGTVVGIKGEQLKVQFFNHIKVLEKNHFALATETDVRKAAGKV